MKKLSPNLVVTDVKASKEFYEKLGFKVRSLVSDKTSPVWASMICGNVEIMLHEKNSAEEEFNLFVGKPLGATLTLFIQTDRLDDLYTLTKSNKWTIVNNMHTTFYGTKEFAILDPDGYVLVFADKA